MVTPPGWQGGGPRGKAVNDVAPSGRKVENVLGLTERRPVKRTGDVDAGPRELRKVGTDG
jgi:hypothetical protein